MREQLKKIFNISSDTDNNSSDKTNNTILSGSLCGKKIHASNGVTLTIQSDVDKNTKANKEHIEAIFLKYKDEHNKLFEYIQNLGTQVYILPYADSFLRLVNEKEGFIYPQKGMKAFYLNLILNKKISFTMPEVFVVKALNINNYNLCYQFYNWYCHKMKIIGFETTTQEKFKYIYDNCATQRINTLSYKELLKLKTAVKRDIEAIDFTKEVAQKSSISKKNLEKIKIGESVRV